MRKNIVAGNWKMNTTLQEGVKLATEVNDALKSRTPNCDVIICVPFTHLASVKAVIDDSKLGLGAENCADKAKGAFTGEVSGAMVASTGAKYVILGHSERRQYFAETDQTVNKRTLAALNAGLKVILCVGESLQQREEGVTEELVRMQTKIALRDVTAEQMANVVIAYEPIWAIGTGKTATAEQAGEVCTNIRATIRSLYGARVARSVTIQYGGSMNPKNAAELLAQPDIDGGLIGGASLNPEDFIAIINAANQG